MTTLRQLEYLVAVADTQNFRRASKSVNITQPTLSTQLKTLEDHLGAKLLERTKTKVMLTPAGARVVQIARRMLHDAKLIEGLARGDGLSLGGVISLGITPTIGPYLLPRVVPEVQKRFPQLKLHIRDDVPVKLSRDLLEGLYDVIITPLPVNDPKLYYVPLFAEPLYLTVAISHPIAALSDIDRQALRDEPILSLGPGHQLHQATLLLCEECGTKLQFDYEGTSLDALREMVATGLGVALMPGLYVRSMLVQDTSLKTLELQGRSVRRTIGMVWRKTSPLLEAFEQLAAVFKGKIELEFPDFV